jgi:large repetitive protein
MSLGPHPQTGSPPRGILSLDERRRVARQLAREASAELTRLHRIRGAYRKTARRIARARARLAFAAALLAAPLAGPALAGTPRFDNGMFGLANVAASARAAFVDIDGDGDLDAFVGERFGITSFFENTGSASAPAFAAPAVGAFGLTDVGFNSAPAFGDIDGDGDLDALIGERYGNTYFFENTGTALAPAFAAPIANAFGLPNVGMRASPALGDIDADGDLDLFLGELGGNLLFFENTGSALAPAFAAAAPNPFGLVDSGDRSVPALGDVDGDGDLDLFVGDVYGSTFFFENTGGAGAPAFAAPLVSPFGLIEVWVSLPALADLDGDGDLDAILGEFYGSTIFFENTATSGLPAFAAPSISPFGILPVTNLPAPTFADIDGDGDLDAFVGNQAGDTLFFENTGTASAVALAAPQLDPFGLVDVGDYASPRFVDIDGDGDLDAFIGAFKGDTWFFRNTGSATAPSFSTPSTNPFGLADVGFRAAPDFVDLDGDGDRDALIGNSLGNTLFFRNTGSSTAPAFAAPSTNPFGLADVGAQAAPSFADLDGDGDRDAFIGELSGATFFFRNTGTASAPAFAAPQSNPFGLLGVRIWATPTFADIDGDGDLDAAIGGYLGRVFFFENLELDRDACRDGLDNDGDGRIDYPDDPGCASAADTSELSTLQCDNGKDDDGDGKIDWRGDGSGDPECTSLTSNREAPAPPQPGCGIGPELLLLTPLLTALRRRRRR